MSFCHQPQLFAPHNNLIRNIKPGLLFRSARPDEASTEDRRRLKDVYKIHTVIDLRTKSEHIVQAQKRSVPVPSAEPLAPSNSQAAEPIKIPGLTYQDINFNGSSYSFALIRQLRYWSTAKLIGLMAAGYRTEAISILGKEVMSERGLIGLAIDSLAHCTAEVQAVFRVLADEKNYPVVIHCTQGKDRTGLTILLVLMLLHVEEAAINSDYMRTQEELVSEREGRVVEIRSIGMPDSFADCDPDWVSSVCAHIGEKYGSIEDYLLHCGVTKSMQSTVRRILLE